MSGFLEWFLGLPAGRLAGGDWRMGFVSEHSNYLTLGLLCALAALIWLTIHLYRREGDVRPRIKTILASLRIIAIVLVLLTLFQPAVILRIRETLYSSVLVLVDDSMSMSFQDRYGSEDQQEFRQQLATELGVAETELETLSRMDILRRQLADPDGPFWNIAREHPVEFLSFSTSQRDDPSYTRVIGALPIGAEPDAVPADSSNPGQDVPDEPTSSEEPQGMEAVLNRLSAAGFQTNHSAALRDAVDQYQGRRIGALIVLSDGQPTNPGAAGRLATAVEYARRIPRLAVMYGDPTPPRNVSVTSLRAPREVREGSGARFQVILTHRNLEGKDVEVRLYARQAGEAWPENLLEQPPLETKTVQLVQADEQDPTAASDARGVQTVTIDHEPHVDDLGEYVYRAVVVQREDELTDEDNYADAFVKVSDQKIRILLVSGDSGWEFQYLRRYFHGQEDLYRLSVWQQNADPEVNQTASTGMRLTRLPRNLRELIDSGSGDTPAAEATGSGAEDAEAEDHIPPGYHVVILYDPYPSKNGFDEEFLKLLNEFVTIHRGGLCYIVGSRNSYDVLSDPAAKPLADLLPVEIAENEVDVARIIHETRPQAWPLDLTSYGIDHPVTRLESASEENRSVWSVMPGVYRTQSVLRIKPGARVLARNSNPTKKTVLKNQPEPLLAAQTVGSGRVLYVGMDESWRWRFIEDGYYHRRFWSNVVRYLAPLDARQVVITTGGDRFSAGDRISLEVEAFDREYKPLRQETLTVRMKDVNTGEITEHELEAIENRPGRYSLDIVAERTGTYELTVPESVADRNRQASKQIVIELPRAEARRSEANPRPLRTLASKPEFFLTAAEIDQLAERLPAENLTTIDNEVHTLWDTGAMLLVVLSLLGVEWFVRKRNNMA